MKFKTLINLSILGLLSLPFTVNANNSTNLKTNDEVVQYLQNKFAEKGISTSIKLDGSIRPVKKSSTHKNTSLVKEKGLVRRNFINEKIIYKYSIYLPTLYKKSPKILIVIPSNKQDMVDLQEMTKFNDIADKKGFIVVYPQLLRAFNKLKEVKNINNTDYLESIINEVKNQYISSSIYLTSWSNASFNLLDLVCEKKINIKGIAIVGSSFLQRHTNDKCLYNFSMLFINGTSDLIMPYDGKINYLKKENLLGMEKTVDFLIKQNKLEEKVIKSEFYKGSIDYTRVKKEIYTKNKKPAVINYKVQFSGHIWPGTSKSYSVKEYGNKTGQINATEIITNFIYEKY